MKEDELAFDLITRDCDSIKIVNFEALALILHSFEVQTKTDDTYEDECSQFLCCHHHYQEMKNYVDHFFVLIGTFITTIVIKATWCGKYRKMLMFMRETTTVR